VEGLRRAGRNLDHDRFISAIESIRELDIGIANRLSFSPVDHQGLEQVYFTRIENGRFVLIDRSPRGAGETVQQGPRK
jgi:hypothetical protein